MSGGGDVTVPLQPEWRLPVSIAVIGERVASLEARLNAEIALRESDMSSIRTSMHEIRSAVQASVAAEYKFALGISELGSKYDSMLIKYDSMSKMVEAISKDIRELSDDRHKVIGGWRMVLAVGGILGIAGSMVVSVVTVLKFMARG